uniref:Uncharacterized protein n=1 Tax=Meloidogyne enterolobii TaxID=390850 RepID=A0A6V7TIY9_MELEN|nr:unnamed protein product [Meloidogyne enterolobii]
MQHSTSHLSNIYSSSSSIISTKSAVFGLSFFRLILISLTIFIIFVQNSNCLQQRNGNQRIRGLRLSSLNDKSEQYIFTNNQPLPRISAWNDWNDTPTELGLRRAALLARLASQSARGFGRKK